MTHFIFCGNLVHIMSTVLTKLGVFFFLIFLLGWEGRVGGNSVAFATSSLNISLFSLAPLKLYTQV